LLQIALHMQQTKTVPTDAADQGLWLQIRCKCSQNPDRLGRFAPPPVHD